MIEGKTKTGFKYKFDERVLEDWKLIDLVTNYDAVGKLEKVKIVPDLVNMLLGNGGFDKLEKHVRSKNEGFCSVTNLQNELFEILQSKELKN